MVQRKSKLLVTAGPVSRHRARPLRITVAAAARVPKKTAGAQVNVKASAGKPGPATPTPVNPAPTKSGSTRAQAVGTADELVQQLDAANARVKELEARLAGVADRIAWIVDRLHSLVDDER